MKKHSRSWSIIPLILMLVVIAWGYRSGLFRKVPATDSATGEKPVSMAEKGQAVAASKGCLACHSADGMRKVGPTWKGVWGTNEELEGGGTAKVDENYVRESILKPQLKVVKGYPPAMPPFAGLVNDDEVNALIAYIKSLK